VKLVGERAASYPAGQWIRGSGWDESKLSEHRYITRKDLDAVSPNNPVWIEHFTGHMLVVNSLALKLAHITRDTPTPSGGVIDKDGSGEPTGVLKDNAQGLMRPALPPDAPDLALRATCVVGEKALATGLTTIHDICLPAEGIRAYQTAHKNGSLKLRVQMAPVTSWRAPVGNWKPTPSAIAHVLSVPSEQLKDVQVLKTFVGGELVYQNAVVR